MKSKAIFFTSVLVVLFVCNLALGDVPRMINYQGKITTPQGALVADTLSITFAIYADSTGGTAQWSETHPQVIIQYGVFSVLLGSIAPTPASIFDGNTKYLGLKIGNDTEMRPRRPIVSVGYAYRSEATDTAEYARTAPAMPDADWTINGDIIYHLNGNVGIGTNQPIFKLDVKTPDQLSNGFRLSSGDYDIISTQNGGVSIKPYPSDWADPFLIQNFGAGGVPRTQIMSASCMGGNGRPNLTYPHLILQPDGGNLGIGTTNPREKLEITASSNPTIALSTIGNSDYPYIRAASNDLTFGTGVGSVEAMRISSGKVGIGTTNPAYQLDVADRVSLSSNTWGGARVFPDGYLTLDWESGVGPRYVSKGKLMFFLDSNNDETGQDFVIYDGGGSSTSATEVFRVTETGDVGIGTSGPNAKLDVFGNGAAVRVSTSSDPTHYFSQLESNYDWNNPTILRTMNGFELLGAHAGNTSLLYGNVGIGTTSPGAKLDVAGKIIASGGSGNAIVGTSSSPLNAGAAVYGISNAGSGTGVGVYGATNCPGDATGSAMGVYGWATSSTAAGGSAFGVLGRCNSAPVSGADAAAGVFGWGEVGSGRVYGVWGETNSGTDYVSGVNGVNTSTTGVTRGVIGDVKSTTAGAAGVLGAAPNTGAVRGVMGFCHSTTGYAIYSDGNFAVAPGYAKNAIVEVSTGTVKLYSQESPEVWFEDFGEGQLNGGKVHVELDPLFLETVTINEQYSMKVFVQLNDECEGVFVKRGTKGFDVIELNNGKSNANFTYRIVAKRKGFETKRLDKTEVVSTKSTLPMSTTTASKD